MVTEALDSGSRRAVTVSRCQMANAALLSSPAIVILLTLMERLLKSNTEDFDDYGKSATQAEATCCGECVEV